jgi:hypothetical protein
MKGAEFLSHAVTCARDAVLSMRNAMTGAAAGAHWQRIGSIVKAVSHDAAGFATAALAYTKESYICINWRQFGPETVQMLKKDWIPAFASIINSATDAMAVAYENTRQTLRAIHWQALNPYAIESPESHATCLVPTGIIAGAVLGSTLMVPVLGVAGLSSIGPVAGQITRRAGHVTNIS